MLDSYIDLNIPSISTGSNFKTRYSFLPESNYLEIIFKEVSRIFRKIRNIIIHKSKDIIVHSDNIDFSWIIINKSTLDWMYSLVYSMFANYKSEGYNKYYRLGIFKYYYDKVIEDLANTSYSDDISSNFLCL